MIMVIVSQSSHDHPIMNNLPLNRYRTNQGAPKMNEDHTRKSIRAFLKRLGISTEQEVTTALRNAEKAGTLSGLNHVAVKATVLIPEIACEHQIEAVIELTPEDH